MLKTMKKTYLVAGTAFTMGLMDIAPAFAQTADRPNVNTTAGKIVDSLSDLPSLIQALSYLAGTALGVFGILKIKNHVENPGQEKLKDGAVLLGAGGALFLLPYLYSVMTNTVGDNTTFDTRGTVGSLNTIGADIND